jgi:hypothetical protein
MTFSLAENVACGAAGPKVPAVRNPVGPAVRNPVGPAVRSPVGKAPEGGGAAARQAKTHMQAPAGACI